MYVEVKQSDILMNVSATLQTNDSNSASVLIVFSVGFSPAEPGFILFDQAPMRPLYDIFPIGIGSSVAELARV